MGREAVFLMDEYTTIYPAPRLPDGWLPHVMTCVRELGKDVVSKGRGPGSLEPEETAGLDYRVVDGEALRHSWLWDWYSSDLMVDLVSAVVGERVRVSESVASAVNINHLRGSRGRYETHVDGQPYSAVLMCDTCDSRTGGRLILGLDDGRRNEYIDTYQGLLVVFDGSVIPHAVEPLTGVLPSRTSIPMVYVPEHASERPAGLDGYLYQDGA